MSDVLSVRWRARAQALPALAVVGEGEVALRLARHVLAAAPERFVHWTGVAGPGVLVLLGDTETLPWVDGVGYLGREEHAPALLLPCTLAPDVAPALLERALVARAGGRTPLAVLPRASRLVPVGGTRPLAREALVSWCERQVAP